MFFCLNRSKPKIALFILALAVLAASFSAQERGEKFLKEVTINGEKVQRWVMLDAFYEYDQNGNELFVNNMIREKR